MILHLHSWIADSAAGGIRGQLRWAFIPAALVLFALVVSDSVAVAADETEVAGVLQNIVAAWEDRSRKFEIVRVEWDESRHYSPGSIFERGRPELPSKFENTGWPSDNVKIAFSRKLALQGTWMRHDSRSVGPSDDWSEVQTSEYLSTFDGDSSRFMMTSTTEGASGSIRQEGANTDAAENSLRPLLYFLRPFNTPCGTFDNASLKLVEVTPEGMATVEDRWSRRAVVDLNRDFVITRVVQNNPVIPGPLSQADITYRLLDGVGWVPSGWELRTLTPANPANDSVRYESVRCRIEVGKPFAKSHFQIEFPIGAVVYDHFSNTEYRQGRGAERTILFPK